MEFRTLKENELEKWFYHCATVFGKGENMDFWLDYFKRHYCCDPYKDVNSIFVAVDKDEIASTVRVFYRKMYLYGNEIKAGGIGEVSTKEKYRGMGLASRLMILAIEKMKSESIDISFLFATLHNFYSNFGYRVFERGFKIFKKDKLKDDGHEQSNDYSKIEKILLSDENIDSISEIYNSYSRKFNGPVVRNKDYWMNWARYEPKECLGYFKNGKLEDYLFYRKNGDEISIIEYGAKDILNYSSRVMELINFIFLNESAKSVRIPDIIDKKIAVGEVLQDNTLMLNLLSPIYLNQCYIESTDELIDYLKSLQSYKFVFWGTDNL